VDRVVPVEESKMGTPNLAATNNTNAIGNGPRAVTLAPVEKAPRMQRDTFSFGSISNAIGDELNSVKSFASTASNKVMATVHQVGGLVANLYSRFTSDKIAEVYALPSEADREAAQQQKVVLEKVRQRRKMEKAEAETASDNYATEVAVELSTRVRRFVPVTA
jgi:hypothetical protein